MSEPEIDSYESWRFAIACLRAEHEAGRKLTPNEMLEMVKNEPNTAP